MNKTMKIVVVVALLVAVGAVVAVKAKTGTCPFAACVSGPSPAETQPSAVQTSPASQPDSAPAALDGEAAAPLPRLVDLGADKCIPCKMMAPLLEELRAEYAGKLTVDFYDVWKNPGMGDAYGVRVIPTQIFYGADGRELWRHEGFLAKADILAKWSELGVDLGSGPAGQAGK